MEIRVLSADFAIAETIAASALAQVAESGFRSVIDAGPADEMAPIARTLGLAYACLPGNGVAITAADVERFRLLLRSLPKPILCATGARSDELYRLAMRPGS